MASGQPIAHAWLMGAISPKRNRLSAYTDPPEPASSGGFLFSGAQLVRNSRRRPERRPGSRGLAQARARLKARGLPEGTRRKPDTDGRANHERFAMAACRSERRDRICLQFGFAAVRGSTNAGGEGFAYFAPRAVKNPPSIDRTVESVRRDGCVAGDGEAQSQTCVSIDVIPISPVPQRAFLIAEA